LLSWLKNPYKVFLIALLEHSLLTGGRQELPKPYTFEFQNIHKCRKFLQSYHPFGRVTPNALYEIPNVLESLKMQGIDTSPALLPDRLLILKVFAPSAEAFWRTRQSQGQHFP